MSKKKQTDATEPIQCAAKHDPSLRCHWIIVKDDNTAVIGYPYRDRSSAESWLAFNNLSGVHVEHRFNQYQNRSDE